MSGRGATSGTGALTSSTGVGGVGGFEVVLLGPGGAGAHKDVGRARIARAIVGTVPVDAGGIAVLLAGTDHGGFA